MKKPNLGKNSEFPIGQRLWSIHRNNLEPDLPQFEHQDDSNQVRAVKNLAVHMISFASDDRPTADEASQEIQRIAGKKPLLKLIMNFDITQLCITLSCL